MKKSHFLYLLSVAQCKRTIVHWTTSIIISTAVLSCGSAETATDDEEAHSGSKSAASEIAVDNTSTSDRDEQSGISDSLVITQYAGSGKGVFGGDGGPASEAGVLSPAGVAVDKNGNLYIASGNRIRRVDGITGIATTVAGTGSPGFGGDGKPATEAKLKSPEGIAIDSKGNLFIADRDNGRIRHLNISTGVITTVAGGGIPKREGGVLVSGDGGPATGAWFKNPLDVDVDSNGNFYFVASGYVRKVDSEGIISTIAGTGLKGLSGDGGPGHEALLAEPQGVAVDSIGNVYIADRENQRVRMVNAKTGIISTVAGVGKHGSFEEAGKEGRNRLTTPEGIGAEGDGGPATSAQLAFPEEVDVFDGKLYIADTVNDRIRMVDLSTGIIITVSDGGAIKGEAMHTGFGKSGDIDVTFNYFGPPFDVVGAKNNTLFIADYKFHRVVKIQYP